MRKWIVLGGLLFILGCVGVAFGGLALLGSAADEAQQSLQKPVRVRYVARARNATALYTNPTGGQTEEEVKGSWEREVELVPEEVNLQATISVTSALMGPDEVTCEIYVAGQRVDAQTSKGKDLVNAVCVASIP